MTQPALAKTQKTSRKDTFRQKQRRQQRERAIVISAVAILALLIAAILLISNLPANIDNYTQPEELDRKMVNSLATGDPDAPIIIELY